MCSLAIIVQNQAGVLGLHRAWLEVGGLTGHVEAARGGSSQVPWVDLSATVQGLSHGGGSGSISFSLSAGAGVRKSALLVLP